MDTSKLNPTAILRYGVTRDSVEAALEHVKYGEGALVVAETLVEHGIRILSNNGAEKVLDDLNWAEAIDGQ